MSVVKRKSFVGQIAGVAFVCLVAGPLPAQQVIILSDIAGNGDGSGTAVPGIVGINADTGLYEVAHFHNTIANTGDALEPVEDNLSINSVFIMNTADMQINTEGVIYNFSPTDAVGTTWNHILKDTTQNFDKGEANIWAGGINTFVSCLGIHSSAGITFDLDNLRADFGAANVKWFSSFMGFDTCGGGIVNLYAILSNGTAVVGSKALLNVATNQGEAVTLEIPDTATYLTLATGANNGADGCDHGVFADAVISSVPFQFGVRSVSSAGDPAGCPPTAGGPVDVTITLEGSGPDTVQVLERAFGPFGKDEVTAQNGGVATSFQPTSADAMTASGFIKAWLLLGPYSQPLGAAPGDDAIRLDYLTDGAAINEIDVQPKVGDTVDTDYNGAAASTGLAVFTGGINPNAVPTWAQHIDLDDTINFNDYYGGDVDNIMMYAVAYLDVAANTTVDFCLGSDDSAQVLLDGAEIFILSQGRGWGASEQCQNSIAAIPLDAGVHTLMVKVFEGGGGHGFRVGVFETGTATPAAGVSVCLNPLAPDPCVFQASGVQIVWNVNRTQLAAGVGYSIDLDVGRTTFRGNIQSRAILGLGQYALIPSPTELGPIADPAFPHAHNIGNPCPGIGVSSPNPGTLVIDGAGADIWQTGDQFMYAYRDVTGDFSARVTITDRVFAPASRWGKHGIMARQDCGVSSRYSFVHDQGEDLQDTTRFAARPTHGGADNFEMTPAVAIPDNHANTLRLDRCGNTFIGYVLDDLGTFGGLPGEWVEVGRNTWTDPAPATVKIGLAVTSHAGCAVTSITFDDWELLSLCEGAVENLACASNAQGGMDLTWENRAGSPPGVPISVQVNGTEVQSLPGTATSATVPASALPPGQISEIRVVNFSGIAATCTFPAELTTQGFIKNWLLLGPYRQPTALGAANPAPDEMRRDHLRNADGSINEIDGEPKAGDTVSTDYGPAGTARSIGLLPAVGGNPNNINPGDVPTWFAWSDLDDTINFNNYYGGDINTIMMHAVTYILVEDDVTVNLCVGSDDAVQVLLDGEEVWLNSIARGVGQPNECQDLVLGASVPALNPLTRGCHKVMVKVFEGGGDHGFRLRFQDPVTLEPFVPKKVGLDPSLCVSGPILVRGDTNADGRINITDPIYSLAFSFQGGPPPPCRDAADADDSFGINITDPIYLLSFLFQGGPRPPAPSPSSGNYVPGDCGLDTTADGLDCLSFPPCN